jgi:hypothetical protein
LLPLKAPAVNVQIFRQDPSACFACLGDPGFIGAPTAGPPVQL